MKHLHFDVETAGFTARTGRVPADRTARSLR